MASDREALMIDPQSFRPSHQRSYPALVLRASRTPSAAAAISNGPTSTFRFGSDSFQWTKASVNDHRPKAETRPQISGKAVPSTRTASRRNE